MAHYTVAGGGIIGMSIAWRLAQSGMRVTVFDAGRIGGEASWAGAGMLAPGGEVEQNTRLAELAIQSLKLYPSFVRELKEESGVAIDFRQCGAIEYSTSNRRAEGQRALGIRSDRLSDSELFYPDDAVVDPRNVVKALRAACERRGVELRENQPLSRVEGPAVIAAGAWSSQLEAPVPLVPSFPVRGHLVSYQMEPGALGPIRREGATYLLQRASGLVIAGSSTERVGFDRTVDQAIAADIDRRARVLFPALPPPREAWVGFRPATDSLEPEIRRLPGTEIFVAYGHYRNGILLAPITASLQMDLILNGADRR